MSDSRGGKTLYFDKEKKAHVIEHEDGGMTAKSHGATTTIDKDGEMRLNMENLRFLGIKNIFDLLEYSITREDNLIRHRFKLVNDGEGFVEFGTDLKLHSFWVNHASLRATPDGDVIIDASDEPKKEGE